MTSIMAKRVGSDGSVFTFEPHPQVFRELAANVEDWLTYPETGRVTLQEIALSSNSGTASLYTTSEFSTNRGTASLNGEDHSEQDHLAHPVVLERLDNVFSDTPFFSLLKMDVEGHELDLLRGATNLLSAKRIRDIIFEEHRPYPSPVTEYLEKFGYQIFSLEQGPLGIQVSPAHRHAKHFKYDAPNYLATLDPQRALKKLRRRGYCVLTLDAATNPESRQVLAAIGLCLALCLYSAVVKASRHPPK